MFLLSLPMRGAWIEIRSFFTRKEAAASRSPCGERGLKYFRHCAESPTLGRSPCGERGLKFAVDKVVPKRDKSLPMRGAWIEMAKVSTPPRLRRKSLPMRGAWIEILQGGNCGQKSTGRSPCGERGLKYPFRERSSLQVSSLPMRGAWIEI